MDVYIQIQFERNVSPDSYLQGLTWKMIKPQIQIRSGVVQLQIERRRRSCVFSDMSEKKTTGSTLREGTRGRCYDFGRKIYRPTRKWCDNGCVMNT